MEPTIVNPPQSVQDLASNVTVQTRFVATDQALLADVLRQLAARPDCYYVKYSVYSRDGMYLGRCFLADEHEVGVLWAKYKEHPRLFCSVQDDDFTAPFRPAD